jgi:EAL domain-containing protein (putative c-di-GMP-specific phosphodiesterase class I)
MINDIAHRLKIESIAECVEDELTLTKLRQIGVGLGQGYLFGKPQSSPDALWVFAEDGFCHKARGATELSLGF